MTVSTIASIAAGITRATSGAQTTKASVVLDSLVANSAQSSTTADSTSLSAAVTLQNQVAQFRVASQNVAQASAVLTSAAEGAGDIGKALSKLKDIANRASATGLSDTERAALSNEFQAARGSINRIVNSTRFNNAPLLDGTSAQLKLSAEQVPGQQNLSVGSFSTDTLFPSTQPDPLDVSSPDKAKQAVPVIVAAQNYVNEQAGNIFALQDGLNYASSTLESAIQNQDAARSTLDDSDFAAVADSTSQAVVQQDNINSLIAQTNRLPTNILQLLAE